MALRREDDARALWRGTSSCRIVCPSGTHHSNSTRRAHGAVGWADLFSMKEQLKSEGPFRLTPLMLPT